MSDALRAAAEQALGALGDASGNINQERGYAIELEDEIHTAIAALRAALSEPASPPAKPLTDYRISDLAMMVVKGDLSVNWLAREIEDAHGIGEQP